MNIWRIQDGRAGHESQIEGLVQAVAERISITQQILSPLTLAEQWRCVRRTYAHADSAPDWLLGAGHSTHCSLLWLKRVYPRAKTIVIMQPSLPLRWFDACIIPAHDQPPPRPNIYQTQGVIGKIRPTIKPRYGLPLLLIGGASRHFDWESVALMDQIEALLTASDQRWLLTTSPRTPADFLSQLRARGLPLEIVPFAETRKGSGNWLAEHLAAAPAVWVTPDSASMIYEALTSGARVGVFSLHVRGQSRVNQAVQHLIQQHRLARTWMDEVIFQPLDDAGAAADWLLS